MAKLINDFNANDVQPAGIGAGSLPVSGKDGYVVMITDSEIKPTADESGGMLVLTLTVQEGEHQGASGPYRLNLYNANEQAKRIAESELSAICRVTGVMQLTDSAQLHGIPFRAVVAKQKVKPGQEDKGYTEVKGVLDVHGNSAAKAQPPVQSGGPASAPAGGPPADFHKPEEKELEQPPANDGATPGWQQQTPPATSTGGDNAGKPAWAQ
jgi:hypothetical protein